MMSSEDKLLRALTGWWAPPGKSTPLRVPRGCHGTVVSVDVLTSTDDTDGMSLSEKRALAEHEARLDADFALVSKTVAERLRPMLVGERVVVDGKTRKATRKFLAKTDRPWDLEVSDCGEELAETLDGLRKFMDAEEAKMELAKKDRRAAAEKGVKMADDVLKEVRVKMVCKRNLQVGDKMAGRHGNKGVVSIVVPAEDMPYDKETGEHVDIVLSPMGVPSRMNVGQVLETHMGLALAKLTDRVRRLLAEEDEEKALAELADLLADLHGEAPESDVDVWRMANDMAKGGVKCALPPFDEKGERTVKRLLRLAGMPESGQRILVDGRTGEEFDMPVTVGDMYMMKLHHMVDTKMHARSTGPYSRVTQQPTQGMALKGGQRLGEMEVWALEGYGAAHNLREMLTIKSDFEEGRKRALDAIVETGEPPKAEDVYLDESSMPESTNVLLNELRALGLDLTLEYPEQEGEAAKARRKVDKLFDSWDEE